jgi:hypothetical protein
VHFSDIILASGVLYMHEILYLFPID